MNSIRNRTSLTLVAAGTLALAACSSPAPPPPPPPPPKPAIVTPAPAPVPAPAPAPALSVASVILGNALTDGKIATAANTFAPKDTIYAIVTTNTTTAATPIIVRWTYQGNQLVKEDATSLATPGPNVTTASIAKPDGLPAGSYTVEVISDGKSISTTPFAVK